MNHPNIGQSWEKVTGKNLSIAGIITGFMAYGAMLVWLDDNFISEAQGAHITTKVDDNRILIEEHIDEYRITNAINQIRQLKYIDYELEQQEGRDGTSQMLSDRRREVSDDLKQAEEYKKCLLKPIQIRPKCEFLAK